ncbi:MAG TPA: deoxyribose-phosphate aldolase [Bacteroidales bacterium]|nr:deoxyribose-phosphate aldolase [Bacteroidales bacterium]HPS15863.1 deoxyribose-phosphate aldolase [Bacteroidales bacterium]
MTEITESYVAENVKNILSKPLENYSSKEACKFALSIIDLTTLEGSDTDKKVIDLCTKAKSFCEKGKDIPNVAAVCVYPPFVKIAKQQLKETNINVASVAGAFPSGQSPIEVKLAEIKYAIDEGADEIDMVISRGKFLEGKYDEVSDEIFKIKKVCGNVHLKVILETGELLTPANIRKASDMAIEAGGDFIKTSTGKINPAATPEAVFVMLEAIKDHYKKTGKKIGIKPAGGISNVNSAMNYLKLVNAVLGKEWMNPHLFRLGASRFADAVLEEILK